MSPKEVNEVNNNPLKIFKNFVNYVGPSGKNLYYNVVGDKTGPQGNDNKYMETYCQYCNEKYRIVKQNYAPCQKIEILDFGETGTNKLISLSSNISTCWLIDPFLNQVEVGDMICLTAFYFMTPQQKFVNQRCISPLVGSFVAFDITKVNPFNQMLDADPKLAGLLFSASSSRSATKKADKSSGVDPKKLGLTLANI